MAPIKAGAPKFAVLKLAVAIVVGRIRPFAMRVNTSGRILR
jgi:hypothetical protein